MTPTKLYISTRENERNLNRTKPQSTMCNTLHHTAAATLLREIRSQTVGAKITTHICFRWRECELDLTD